jgi:hypothetical protein
VQALGRADDAARADGADVLSFEQAKAKAHAMVASPNGNGNDPIVRLTVRQYIDYKHHKGQPVGDLISRSNVHITPTLGDLVVSELTAEQLRRWLATMAAAPAQRRAKGNRRSTGLSQPPTRSIASAAPRVSIRGAIAIVSAPARNRRLDLWPDGDSHANLAGPHRVWVRWHRSLSSISKRNQSVGTRTSSGSRLMRYTGLSLPLGPVGPRFDALANSRPLLLDFLQFPLACIWYCSAIRW